MKKTVWALLLITSIAQADLFHNDRPTQKKVLIKDEDTALEQVIESIERHKLTTLSKECLLFIPDDKGDYYEIEVREKHNEICGGDLHTSPRLFTYKINKYTGKMLTDEPVWTGEMRNID